MCNVLESLNDHLVVADSLLSLHQEIAEVGKALSEVISKGHKILFFGNGGSASDSQHLAAELVGRLSRDRPALPAISLTADSSLITALSNDFSYKYVFSRQVEALCQPGDAVVGISTSGNSPNVVAGLRAAYYLGGVTIGLSGRDGGEMKGLCHQCIEVPSENTARVQEGHILIGHIVCDWIETEAATHV